MLIWNLFTIIIIIICLISNAYFEFYTNYV